MSARSQAETGKRALNSAAVHRARADRVPAEQDAAAELRCVRRSALFSARRNAKILCILRGKPVALTICEDAWNDRRFWKQRLYQRDPVEELFEAGRGDHDLHQRVARSTWASVKFGARIYRAAAQRYSKPVVYVNQVGGNDQLVFDGSSFAMNGAGEMIASARSFEEDLVRDMTHGDLHEDFTDECEAVYQALVLGTRDYIRKCGFSKVLIGLSGGIDSALTAVIAVEAVGKENVTGVGMPGPYSSDHSVSDAREMAEKLGIRFEIVPISAVYELFYGRFAAGVSRPWVGCHGRKPAIAPARRHADGSIEQNRRAGADHGEQERARGGLLHSVRRYVRRAGGDQRCAKNDGILAVANREPTDTMERFPKACSPNLRRRSCEPDQKDTDSLPPYEVLDRILEEYVEQYKTPKQIAEAHGLPIELVQDIVNKVDRNEYKRQQAAPGLKVTTQGFRHRAQISHRAEVFRMKQILSFTLVVIFAVVLGSQPSGRETCGQAGRRNGAAAERMEDRAGGPAGAAGHAADVVGDFA